MKSKEAQKPAPEAPGTVWPPAPDGTPAAPLWYFRYPSLSLLCGAGLSGGGGSEQGAGE